MASAAIVRLPKLFIAQCKTVISQNCCKVLIDRTLWLDYQSPFIECGVRIHVTLPRYHLRIGIVGLSDGLLEGVVYSCESLGTTTKGLGRPRKSKLGVHLYAYFSIDEHDFAIDATSLPEILAEHLDV